MVNRLTVVTAPTHEAVSLSEVKRALRITHQLDDVDLAALIAEATEFVQEQTGRQLVTATYDYSLDKWPSGSDPIPIPRPPLQSVASVKYLDSDEVEQTVAASVYEARTDRTPGIVRLKKDQSWPTKLDRPDTVTIRFDAGYGDAASVSARAKTLIKLYVGHRYENRDAYLAEPGLTSALEMPLGVQSLVSQLSVELL